MTGESQMGQYLVTVAVTSNGEYTGSTSNNRSMRWKFGYSTMVYTTSGFPSGDDAEWNPPQVNPWDIIWQMIFFLLVAILIGLVLDVLFAPAGIIWTAIVVSQILVAAVEIADLVFLQVDIRNDLWIFKDEHNPLAFIFRGAYDWIIDPEGTLARMTVMGDQYNLIGFYWEGEDQSQKWESTDYWFPEWLF